MPWRHSTVPHCVLIAFNDFVQLHCKPDVEAETGKHLEQHACRLEPEYTVPTFP